MAEIHAARRAAAAQQVTEAGADAVLDHLRPERPLSHRPGQLERRGAAARGGDGGAGHRLAVRAGRAAGQPGPRADRRAVPRAAAGRGDDRPRPAHRGLRGARDDGRAARGAGRQGRWRAARAVRPDHRGTARGQGSRRARAAGHRVPDQRPGHRRRLRADQAGPDRTSAGRGAGPADGRPGRRASRLRHHRGQRAERCPSASLAGRPADAARRSDHHGFRRPVRGLPRRHDPHRRAR